MSTKPARPLSPHLQVYKWGPHMAASTFTRITAIGLASLGALMLTWWLFAVASGEAAYATFLSWATWKPMLIVPIGLTWALFQHLAGGLRHFVLDMGAGFELKQNRLWSILTFVFSLVMTIIVWLMIYAKGVAA